MIKLKNVFKVYKMGGDLIHAIDNVSLEIADGEFVSIVGASGSGKTTLMHLIGGLDKPTSGKIFVDNVDLSTASDKQMAIFRNSKIGFVFQNFNLQSSLSSLENVMLPLIYGRVARNKRKRLAEEALEKVGLADRMFHKPSQLSGGQRQRVSIARALVNNPKIILADEPTGNLDTKTGESIIKMIDKLNEEEKITVIVVTHDRKIADAGERIITLSDGKIIDDKSGKNLGKNSQFLNNGK